MSDRPAFTEFEDRYHAVGLRNNPFAAVLHESELSAAHFVDRGLPLPPAPGSNTLVQVIGDQGAGKTTHVQHWRRGAPGPYHYIPRAPYRGRWGRAPIGPIVYGDEIDRMPRPLRRRWFRQLGALGATAVIGTHADLSKLARSVGFAVVTHHLEAIDATTLGRIIAARLATARLDGSAEHINFSSDDIEFVHQKSGGSIRLAEIYCHELLAERVR